MERRWPGWHLRPPPAHVPRPGAVERPRSVPEGAYLRAQQPGGQSRRGRQGILVVRRRDADLVLAALALSLSAGRVSIRAAPRGERTARQGGPRIRADRHRGV